MRPLAQGLGRKSVDADFAGANGYSPKTAAGLAYRRTPAQRKSGANAWFSG